jgi:hypothetical protein
MIILHSASAAEKLDATQNARIAAYSDGDCACKQNASMQAMRQLLET